MSAQTDFLLPPCLGGSYFYRPSTLLLHGFSEELIASVSKKKKYEVERLGTKTVKTAERLDDVSGELGPESATTYRALAARVNDLSIDRPDIAFTAKE